MANKIMYYALLTGAKVAKIIPRRVGHAFLGSIGFCIGYFPTSISRNLKRIHAVVTPTLNSKELRLRSANVLKQYSKYWWDVLWLSSKRSKAEIENIVSVEGFDEIYEYLKGSAIDSKGIIFVLPHIGSWEIAGAWIANQGFHPLVVAERLKPKELFDLFTKTRNAVGMDVIAHDDSPSAKLLAGLNNGRIVCLVADRDMSKKGIKANFFGKDKTFPAVPGVLSKKTGALIIPVCVYLSRNGRITITFGKRIEPSVDEDPDNLKDMTQKIANEFETMILKDPEQWHVLHYEWLEK